MAGFRDWLFGKRLPSSEYRDEKVGPVYGIPTLGLDAISSAAYGPEAALTILIPLGIVGVGKIIPITAVILILLLILYFSYRQTIVAYPNGGGSYTVASENLGRQFGIVAASALMLDYTLNVSVGISAGVGAIISAVPSLHHYTLMLCLLILTLITIVNLRGVREAGVIFAVPTYLYAITLGVLIVIGIAKSAQGSPHSVIAPPTLPPTAGAVTVWLLLKAFASGCTAMTGVEAVSNGITIFNKPAVDNARRTLTWIVVILSLLLLGIAFLTQAYHIGAMDENKPGYQSVISLLLMAVIGKGWFYYLTLACVLAVLILSANTSYAGFPRLCRLLSLDEFLPESFSMPGRRLVYTIGIEFLTGLSAAILILFNGITDKLIPLFAVGAFLAFTLSQAGMVVHWIRHDDGLKSRGAMVINAIGAISTGSALVVILIAKFTSGAWVTLLLIPLLTITLFAIKRHYMAVDEAIEKPLTIDVSHNEAPIAVVPVQSWNMLTARALRFAIRLTPDVNVVHVKVVKGDDDSQTVDTKPTDVEYCWKRDVEDVVNTAGLNPPSLKVMESPYRQIFEPLKKYLLELRSQFQDRLLVVIIPELVETRWYEWILHNHDATALKADLLLMGDSRIVVINVPYYFRHEQ